MATIERLGRESGLWATVIRTDTEPLTKKKLEYNARNLNDFDAVLFYTGGSLEMDEQQKADLRNQIALEVKTALINLGSARNEVQVTNSSVQLSNEEVDQARDRFRAGVANNIEVIQAQDSLARANDNQIAALYRFNQARADLARSIGQMEKIYAK
jgi:hypothetical protein